VFDGVVELGPGAGGPGSVTAGAQLVAEADGGGVRGLPAQSRVARGFVQDNGFAFGGDRTVVLEEPSALARTRSANPGSGGAKALSSTAACQR
jgi:hypothetical protein